MDSSNDNLFPEERPDARHALLELFPEELEELKAKRAEEIFERILPKITEIISAVSTAVDEELEGLHSKVDGHTEEGVTIHKDIQEAAKSLTERFETLEKLPKALSDFKKGVNKDNTDLLGKVDVASKATSEIAYRALNLYNDLNDKIPDIYKEIKRAHTRIDNLPEEFDDTEIWEELRELRARLNNQRIGGGSMNRNVAVGGNQSVLAKYTDINLKPGSNVTLTYSSNDATKYTDITIAATGGGGGTSRSVNNISTSQTASAVASTDFVYIASAGIALTLPATVGNNNLYTVKNTSSSSVLLATTGADTIDSQATIILATQYTAVDLISDGVSNWNLT